MNTELSIDLPPIPTINNIKNRKISYNSIHDLRKQCNVLIEHENMDKNLAVEVLNLFHNLETEMYKQETEKNKEIEKLNHEIDILHLCHKNAEMLLSITNDIIVLKQRMEEIVMDNNGR